jgi:CheY-like chemotaxis protein
MAGQPELAPPGRYACLIVADTGTGMSPDTRQRIFEPFFTTKPAEEGTGLGLAMVYSTVRAHRGFIDVSSAPDAGTTFTIYVPEADAEAETVAVDPGRPMRGVGRILLVDDEEAVRTVVARMLGVLGFEVTTAPDGEDAVALVAASPQGFDLVILDGNMPRVPGREAARQIRTLAPSLPLLLATGYLEPGAVDGVEADGFSGTLIKPYDLNQLSRAVASHLPGHR